MPDVRNSYIAPERAILGWQIGLWCVQLLLCLFFGMSGIGKTFFAPEHLVRMGVNYAMDIPLWALIYVGIAEMVGAAGIVMPALMRIEPPLAPLAGLGLASLQVLKMGFHIMRGEIFALPINLILLGLSLFVVWARGRTLEALLKAS